MPGVNRSLSGASTVSWTRPRTEYPEGRAGYLRWRAAAKRRHADEVGALLLAQGYDAALVDRVGAIIRKEGLGEDPVAAAEWQAAMSGLGDLYLTARPQGGGWATSSDGRSRR